MHRGPPRRGDLCESVFAALAMVAALTPALAVCQHARPLTMPLPHRIDQWTTADGLPQNSVNAIALTPDGYLWVGTFGGLARFDGTSFTLVERVDSGGRHLDRILSLAVGADGALWIGTEDGLVRWKDGSYRAYGPVDGLPEDEIPALHVTTKGTVWVGTARAGVLRLAGDRFERDARAAAVPPGRVHGIVEEGDGTLWVNLGDRAIAVAPPGGDRSSAKPLPRAIEVLLRDREGGRWFATAAGVVRDPAAAAPLAASLRRLTRPTVMIEDPVSGYWLGTRNDGLLYVDSAQGGAVRHYALPDGRRTYRVRAALMDGEGNVWIGTNANGLLRAKRNLFTTFTTANGLSHDVATAVYGDRAGTVWVGTNCGGVNAIDWRRRTVRVFSPRRPGDPLGDPCNFALTEAPDGTMWQGTWGGGVTRLTGSLAGKRHRVTGLPDSVVRALFTDRDGVIWIGTEGGGLAAIEDGRVRATYTTADGLAHNSVRVIQQTRDGALWVGTLDGLSRLGDGRFMTYVAADGLAAGHVRAIHEDADGTLWIGTYGGGVHRLRDGVFVPITRQQGLADDVVSAILEDQHGHLWMTGNLGIQRVVRDDLNRFAEGEVGRVHAVLYGVADGLVNAEANGGFQPAAWMDARGRLWFPTVQGVAVVDPAGVHADERAPPVAIDEVIVNGVSRKGGGALAIGRGRVNVEFRYTGLSLAAPEHLRFRYRLEGYDESWVEAGDRRSAPYHRVPPGRYRFAVTAVNRDGVWSRDAAAISLRIAAPFWATWWFRFGAMALLTGVAVTVVRRRAAAADRDRAAQLEFSRALIESQEHERKRIARELHDGLGQELLVVKNRALLALRSDGLDAGAREQLRHITDVVTESLEDVRTLAHNLTPHQLDHLGLSAALRAMIDDVAQTSGIALDATIENVDGQLGGHGEINLYRIVQESLSNVMRHSGARAASVHVRRGGDRIHLTIVDRGRGFRADGRHGPDGGFGLNGIVERARTLGGVAKVVSAPGQGTRIDISVPIAGAARASRDAARAK